MGVSLCMHIPLKSILSLSSDTTPAHVQLDLYTHLLALLVSFLHLFLSAAQLLLIPCLRSLPTFASASAFAACASAIAYSRAVKANGTICHRYARPGSYGDKSQCRRRGHALLLAHVLLVDDVL